MGRPNWRRWPFIVLLSIAALAIAGLVTLRLLEKMVAKRFFTTPAIAAAPQPQAIPFADYNFQYASLDGQPHHLADLKGKVIFVNLWGTWCIRCIAEMPSIQTLYNQFADDPSVVFLIASRLDTPKRVRLYAKYGRYTLPFYTVEDSAIPKPMEFNQYPTTFIFAKDGSVAETQIGGADWSAPSVANSIRQLEAR
jgi:thiol-disulfide isomerase/thioredoxin